MPQFLSIKTGRSSETRTKFGLRFYLDAAEYLKNYVSTSDQRDKVSNQNNNAIIKLKGLRYED